MITEAEVCELAEAFIKDKRAAYKCGARCDVKHISSEMYQEAQVAVDHGTCLVSFEYTGPPINPEYLVSDPPPDAPTTVCVNDLTGECEILMRL